MAKYKFIDLFAGIGGFHLAFHNLGGIPSSEEIRRQIAFGNRGKKYFLNLDNLDPCLIAFETISNAV